MANKAKTERVDVVIDDRTISSGDPVAIIDPVWWTANIYDGPTAYEASLSPFSTAQRWVSAINWYDAEVCNGGHEQFYSNSTGIVWKDALAGLEAFGLEEMAAILRESAARLGGEPSLNRAEREAALSRLEPDFDDLDDRYYSNRTEQVEEAIMRYVRERPTDFYFSGVVEKPTTS